MGEVIPNPPEGRNFAVGYNMPGYLPEAEVFASDTWDEAKAVMLCELEAHQNQEESEDDANKWKGIILDLEWDVGPEWDHLGPDGYAYWIQTP